MREIFQEEVRAIANRFQTHLDNDFYLCILIESIHYQLARNWIGQFNTSLRTLDALHLACASSNNLCLVTADEALAASAEALGVKCSYSDQILILANLLTVRDLESRNCDRSEEKLYNLLYA